MHLFKKIQLLFFFFLFLVAAQAQQALSTLKHPKWSKNLSIYEVNIRQFSKEGTFAAFENELPKLKALGTDLLWLMPIQPIGEKNRKGTLGSYYAVKDYTKVNPEFGTMEDFKRLVKTAHALDMYVILDWVANHTAPDHPWAAEHSDWFTKNAKGEFIPPMDTDWTDVIDLNYDSQGMRKAMKDALLFWVKEADIDGYRCDVAKEVPTDFWNAVRPALDEIKPVFMLAEAELPEHHWQAFDMSYGWEMHHLLSKICKGEKKAGALAEYFEKDTQKFPVDAYRMYFTQNHDENSWKGTQYELFGEGLEAAIVICATVRGMPLVYNGQEAGLDKKLQFFEKDPIVWKESPLRGLFTKLFQLKKNHPALWNGNFGGEMKILKHNRQDEVFAFRRSKGKKEVVVLANLSPQKQEVTLAEKQLKGKFQELFSKSEANIQPGQTLSLKAWEYKVLFR